MGHAMWARRAQAVLLAPFFRASPRAGRPLPVPRAIHASARQLDIPQWPNPPTPQPAVTPYDAPGGEGKDKKDESTSKAVWKELAASPLVQAGVTTVVGLVMV